MFTSRPWFGHIIVMEFILRNTEKAMWEHGIKGKNKTLLDLDYSDSAINENVSKMNGFLEVLKGHGGKIGLEVNVKKNVLLKLGISEGEGVIICDDKIDQRNSLHY